MELCDLCYDPQERIFAYMDDTAYCVYCYHKILEAELERTNFYMKGRNAS